MPRGRHNFEKLLRSAHDLQNRQRTAEYVLARKQDQNPGLFSKHAKEISGLVLDLVVAAIPGVAPMPTLSRWCLWTLCLGTFVFLVQPLFIERRLRFRLGVALAFMVTFVSVWGSTVRSQWREEQASKDEGDLTVDNPTQQIFPMVQLADTRTAYPVSTPIKFFDGAEISFGIGKDGATTVTTTIEDRLGHRLVQVTKNHWQVFADAGEKNYTHNALEVLDRGGHVVLQLRLLSDRIVIWGAWHNEFDQAIQLTECPNPNAPNTKLACFQVFGPALPEKSARAPLEKMFQYPSKTHWGELRHK